LLSRSASTADGHLPGTADFLTINKQIEQLGEVRHGRELVV
jgi:hypothetical protein